MSVTVFPKTVKKYTVINDKLFEDDALSPSIVCYSGEGGTLEIQITLDDVWQTLGCQLEAQTTCGACDVGGVINDNVLCYTVPHAIMKVGVMRFHLRGVLDGNIRKTADAYCYIGNSFDVNEAAKVYEPSAFEDLLSTVANIRVKTEQNERNIEQLASDLSDAEVKYQQTVADRDLVTSAIMRSAPVTNLDYAFENSEITQFPALDMSKVESMQYSFRNCGSLLELPDMDLSSCTTLYECFRQCSSLIKVGKLTTLNVKKMYSLFRNCSNLETIEEIDLSSVDSMNLIFANCRKLQNITFAGSINITIDFRNTNSTAETLVSAINALCEDGTDKIIYLGSLADRLTDEQKKIATDKGWTIG